MSDQPSTGPPPVANKPNVFPMKRAGLKRTFSVGASPKKSQVVSTPKMSGIAGGSLKWAALGDKNMANVNQNDANNRTSANSQSASSSAVPNVGSASHIGTESGIGHKAPLTTLPGLEGAIGDAASSQARPRSRPPSGSMSSATMTSSRINSHLSSGNNGAISPRNVSPLASRPAPGRLSVAAYASFAGEQTAYTGPLSPRSSERKAEAEEPITGSPNGDDSNDPMRPRRPAAPPRPATLRGNLGRASPSSPNAIDPSSPSSIDDTSPNSQIKGSPSPVKTGAQLRPPVPRKNISQAHLSPELAVRSANGTPNPHSSPISSNETSSGFPPSSSLSGSGSIPNDTSPPSSDPSALPTTEEPKVGTSPVLKRTQTPRSLMHFRSGSTSGSSNMLVSPSEPKLGSSHAIATPSSSSSPDISAASGSSKEVDDRGRVVTAGKPRSQDYYQLDLAALDLDVGKKKSSGFGVKLGSLAKGIANSVKPKRSPSETSLEGAEEGEVVDTSGWPTIRRVKLEWPELITATVAEDNLKMIDQSILKDGFHVELGDTSVTTLPTALGLDHCGEYVPYYKTVLYGVDHSNYVAYEDESDMYWVVSIEEKPKGKRQDQLRALVRNRKDYVRINVDVSSLSSSFTDNFSKGSSVKMAALSKLMPELEKLKWVRVKNPDLNDELASMEEKEVKLGSAYKFGVLYVRPGQTEDEIFANNDPKPEFMEFMEMMATKVDLLGWDKYRGGLDVKNQSTGEHSFYHEIHGVSVMFHVCTMLPSQENDVQRVERKRHIGNDVVTFVYLEEGCEPYLATKLTSQFIHIHYVIQRVPGTGVGSTNPIPQYRIAVVTKYGVEPHAPSLASPATYPASPALRDFLLTKAVNSERTAMLATEFRSKMLRARKDFLKHLYENFSTNKKKARGSSASTRHDA